ncbi:hypothetical protein BX600DRAFT_478131 [Xylariales sp. PMI_506]|nr:hypothetical protein BX600DRAFT_478131 [Xylariales sp. PMI_506]
MATSHTATIATRAIIITLKACTDKTNAEIEKITGIETRQINRIYSRVIARGFDPNLRPLTILPEWLEDAPPRKSQSTKRELESGSLAADKLTRVLQWDGLTASNLTDPPHNGLREDEIDSEAWTDEEDD